MARHNGGGAPFEEGDRIELDAMPKDPDPIFPGTRGTVRSCDFVSLGAYGGGYWQIGVEWDNGRTLMLCVPPDSAHRVPAEKEVTP